jgi:hypothetical protein
MINPIELKSRWQEALKSSYMSKEEEYTSIMCENDWVRILATHSSENGGRIEVEVSLPSQKDPQSGKDVKDFIQNLIKHLEYLLRLDEKGMTLGVMSRDGLWTAFLDIENLSQNDLFSVLVPPT